MCEGETTKQSGGPEIQQVVGEGVRPRGFLTRGHPTNLEFLNKAHESDKFIDICACIYIYIIYIYTERESGQATGHRKP